MERKKDIYTLAFKLVLVMVLAAGSLSASAYEGQPGAEQQVGERPSETHLLEENETLKRRLQESHEVLAGFEEAFELQSQTHSLEENETLKRRLQESREVVASLQDALELQSGKNESLSAALTVQEELSLEYQKGARYYAREYGKEAAKSKHLEDLLGRLKGRDLIAKVIGVVGVAAFLVSKLRR